MKLNPKSVNALAVLPKRKYFRPASAERTSVLSNAVMT